MVRFDWLPLAVVLAYVLASLAARPTPPPIAPPEPEPVLAVELAHPWCGEPCEGLPNLGTEPRVGRRR